MRVDHFAFEVSNLGRSVAFYRDVLGLPLIMQQADEEHGEAFAFLKDGRRGHAGVVAAARR